MHVSLDGYVAGPNGELDWIQINPELFDVVEKRIGGTDTALYGRMTYELMESYWPTAADQPNPTKHDIEHSKWYSKAHKIVLSKTLNESDLTNTTILSDNLTDKINAIKQSRNRVSDEILLFGSPTATHALMQLGLIDGFWLFVNPIILGQGMPLFADVKDQLKLDLLHTHQFNCGVMELSYMVNRE